jgi:hypothetical protein
VKLSIFNIFIFRAVQHISKKLFQPSYRRRPVGVATSSLTRLLEHSRHIALLYVEVAFVDINVILA